MAILRNFDSGKRVMLRPSHVFGRSAICQTVLTAPEISKIHALVRWRDSHWEIFGQGCNGTRIDGVRLLAGEWRTLRPGNHVNMGEGAEAQWLVEDVAAPTNCLLPARGEPLDLQHATGEVPLPSGENPEAHLFWYDGKYMLVEAGRIVPVHDGAIITTSQMTWELVLCPDMTCMQVPTSAACAAHCEEVMLRFEISQDEEHVHLFVAQNGCQPCDLGERTHHYLLAVLARHRLRDAKRGFDSRSQGWIPVSTLSTMLAMDPSHINIQIHRARRKLAEVLPHAPPLVERRRGEVRLGNFAFTILQGSKLEGELRQRREPAAHEYSTGRALRA